MSRNNKDGRPRRMTEPGDVPGVSEAARNPKDCGVKDSGSHCPICKAGPFDAVTLWVHKRVCTAPTDSPLSQMSDEMMPANGGLITAFGEEFAGWMLEKTDDHSHACATGDCGHRDEAECRRQLVKNFFEERKHG